MSGWWWFLILTAPSVLLLTCGHLGARNSHRGRNTRRAPGSRTGRAHNHHRKDQP